MSERNVNGRLRRSIPDRRPHKNRARTMVVSALGLILTAGLALAQNQPFTIQVDVPLVAVNVEVSDSYGRPVSSLHPEDFLVYEDGQLQSLQTFGSADSPYSLILTFDCSDSTARELPLLNDAVSRFSEYRRPLDRVLIAAFGTQTQIIRNWKERKDHRLESNVVCGGTKFYDAVRWTIDRMRGVKGRRGVVMLTDAVDSNIPKRPAVIDGRRVEQFVDFGVDREFKKALREIEKSGISYYFVAVSTDRNPGFEISEQLKDVVLPDIRQMRLRMEEMASVSGGSVVYPTETADVIPMYQQLAERLGSTYSLGYVSTNHLLDGRSRKIEVRVRPKDLRVHQSRDAYSPRRERIE
jgi:VWFA-related protein